MGDVPDYSVQPRPLEVDGAVSAHDLVIADLVSGFSDVPGVEFAVAAMQERKDYGLEKYGVVLHKDNGRNYAKDVDDEIGDLVAYLRVYLERHPELDPTFGEDYIAALRILIRWRSALPSLLALEES